MVSDADRAAEETVVALLRRERPDDALVAEEGASASGGSGRRWIVDPLDGTTNFLYGIPQWAVSVAVEDGDGGLAGVVFAPAARDLFRAERGGGAELVRGAVGLVEAEGSAALPLRVRDGTPLERSLIATGFGYDAERREWQAQTLVRMLPHVRDIRRAGAAALDLAWLAAGRLDGYWERGLSDWDWAAGRLLVQEAGGVVAELPGEPHGLVAAGPALFPALEELVVAAERGEAT
jgi:myo-inositol-1(or 4)-monophosphatase